MSVTMDVEIELDSLIETYKDEIFSYINYHYHPEDVFETNELEDWAVGNGWSSPDD